jgi:hypothetical protein
MTNHFILRTCEKDGSERASKYSDKWSGVYKCVELEIKTEVAMTTWKRLSRLDGSKVDINIEHVTYMKSQGELPATSIFFVNTTGNEPFIVVTETPDQIHMAQSPRSFG